MFGNEKKKNQKKGNGKKAEQKKPDKLAVKNQNQKKPAKPVAPKASAVKKPSGSKQASTSKKTVAPKKAPQANKPQLKPIMHSDKDEMNVDDVKPIVIKGAGAAKPKRVKKELRRVAKSGGFTAWDGRTGKTFATKKEADDYAAEKSKEIGEKIEVSRTNRQVTHTFTAEARTDK